MQRQDLRSWVSFSLLTLKTFSRNIFSTKKKVEKKSNWFLLSPGPLKDPELVKKLVQFFHASSQFKLLHKYFSSGNIQCCLIYKNPRSSFSVNITSNCITHLFPMHPFSTPWKPQKTVRFSDVFREQRKRALETNGLTWQGESHAHLYFQNSLSFSIYTFAKTQKWCLPRNKFWGIKK